MTKRRWLAALTAAMLACTTTLPAVAGPEISRCFPVLPPDGAVVGPRPVFQLGYESLEDPHPRKLRFRIRLDPQGPDPAALVFDQRERRSGWLVGEPGHMIYRPRRPLPDGRYRWDVAVWNGVEWSAGGKKFDLRVDSIPPASVEGLRVELRQDGEELLLEWEPVTLDRNGAPEFVTRYHVYRFTRRGLFRRVRSSKIAVVEQPRFVATDVGDRTILFYRITAEDVAGNEGGLLE